MEFGGGDAQNGGSSGQGFMSESNFADVDMSNDADHMQDPANDAATQESKEEVDSRSVFVGNKGNRRGCYLSPSRKQVTWQHTVDYACTPEEVQQHFQSCGTVNRITIPTDKFGQPKGFAYVEFVETEAVEVALLLNDTKLHGRQLKVMRKRTNIPGMKQFRPRRSNPSMGFGYRRPAPAYMFSPYGYGRVPRYRRPARYMPYYFSGGA